MASNQVVIGKLRYDIVSDSTKFEKGLRASRKELKRAEKAMKDSFSPITKLRHERIRLNSDLQKGLITQKAYIRLMRQNTAERLRLTAARRAAMADAARFNAVMAKTPRILQGTVGWLGRTAMAWRKAKREKAAYAATPVGRGPVSGRGGLHPNSLANFGGSLGSGLGLGGPGAGIGRMLGMAGMGTGGGVLAGIGSAAIYVQAAVKEFATLETAVVDLQVLMGDERAGEAFVKNLRKIARETPLTTSQLVKNAQTMLGYGISADGLEDTLKRLGEVAGGDTMKFDGLTRAFSQITTAGKLMGQELLQLINAGFPIAEIAKQAGVEMKDFRKEMENGAITADHVNQALIALTSEGGLMFGRLDKQADTVSGHWTRMKGEISESMSQIGERFAPFAHSVIEGIKGITLEFNGLVNTFADWGEKWSGLIEDMGRLGGVNVIKETWKATKDFIYWTQGVSRDAVEQAERVQQLYEDLYDARRNKRKAAQAQIKSDEEKREKERLKRQETFDERRKANIEEYNRFVEEGMSEEEKRQKELSDLKQSYLNEEIDVFQYHLLKRQMKYLHELQRQRKKEEELLEKRKKMINDLLQKRKEQIDQEAAKQKKMVEDVHKMFRDAAVGNNPSVDSAQGGSDYKFLADRQKEVRDFKAEQVSNKKREQQLNDIKRNQRIAHRKAERTATAMETWAENTGSH